MHSWVLQITMATLAAFVVGAHPVSAAAPGSAFDRASLLTALTVNADVQSPRSQAQTVGRAVALRAVMRPIAIPDGITLQRIEIAAVPKPPRRL